MGQYEARTFVIGLLFHFKHTKNGGWNFFIFNISASHQAFLEFLESEKKSVWTNTLEFLAENGVKCSGLIGPQAHTLVFFYMTHRLAVIAKGSQLKYEHCIILILVSVKSTQKFHHTPIMWKQFPVLHPLHSEGTYCCRF